MGRGLINQDLGIHVEQPQIMLLKHMAEFLMLPREVNPLDSSLYE